MELIPLQAKENQTINIVLGSQNCTVKVFQKSTGIFVDFLVNDVYIARGVLAVDRVRLLRLDPALFDGDIFFYDAQGTEKPFWTGLNSRWFLMYLGVTEVVR